LPLNEHPVEDESAVSFKIQKAYVFCPTERLRLWREIGGDEDGRSVKMVPANVIPQLQQGHPHVTRLAIGLDLADELVMAVAYVEVRQNIDLEARALDLALDALHGDRRHLRKKRLQGLSGAGLNLFHRFDGFHHLLKMLFLVNDVNYTFTKMTAFNVR
jgi:hypothetical protein